MTILALSIVWCGSGLSALRFGGLAPAKGAEGWADAGFAAMLGPFSYLLAHLASQMEVEEEREPEAAKERLNPPLRRR
jgi:hypothetical protein